jgi:hypothetical protein
VKDDAAEKERRAPSFQALHGQRNAAKAASRCAHPTPGKGGIVRFEAERPTKEKVVDVDQEANDPNAPTRFVNRVKQLEERVITMVVSEPTCRSRRGVVVVVVVNCQKKKKMGYDARDVRASS